MKKILFSCIVIVQVVCAQTKLINGTVTDEANQPLPGVTVNVAGQEAEGTMTDIYGRYSLSVKPSGVLKFSFIGMKSQTLVVGDKTTIDVIMVSDVSQLEELIVVGYGVQKKKLATGAISQVAGEDLEKTHNVRVDQALQSASSGIQVSSGSGQPGEAAVIRVRGVGTVGDANPLYLVDGVPVSDIGYLSPSDIQSVDILKDAASSAIYGSRAANGIILITTKKGVKGTFRISYDGYRGIQNPIKKLDMLNAQQYAQIMNEQLVNSGKAAKYTQAEIDALGEGTDWQELAFYRNAPTQNHTLSMSGGGEKMIFSSSVAYLSQEGTLAKGMSSFDRLTLRFNSEQYVVKDVITTGLNVTFAHSVKQGNAAGSLFSSRIGNFLAANPILPWWDKTTNDYYDVSQDDADMFNPLADIYRTTDQRYQKEQLIGNFYAKWDIVKGLQFKTDIGTDIAYNYNRQYEAKYDWGPRKANQFDNTQLDMSRNFSYNFENTLKYHKEVGKHQLNALLGTTVFKHENRNLMGYKQKLLFEGFNHAYLDNATDLASARTGGGISEYALLSYFGRVNWNYDEKYLFMFSLRSDGSSRFAKSNRFGYFPAVSAGWNISQESFWPVDWLQDVKIRGSWGQNGNQSIGNFRYLASISNNRRYVFGKTEADEVITPGSSPAKIPNPELLWETSQQTNIGMDMRLLDDFRLTVDWYDKRTKDWLVTAPVGMFIGNANPTINGGEVKNTGYEFTLDYKHTFNDFYVNAYVNLGYNKNKVVSISNEEGIIHGPSANVMYGGTHDEVYRAQEGFPIGYFYGLQTAGVFQNQTEIDNYKYADGTLIQPNAQPGDIKFVDRNGKDGIEAGDRTMIGNPWPSFTYSGGVNLEYKGVDFSLIFQGVQGNEILNFSRNINRTTYNYQTKVLGRWHGEGTSNSLPRLTDDASNYTTMSDLHVENGSYLRVKTITLGYDLKKIISFKALRQLRVYTSLDNYITLTNYSGYDPDIAYAPSSFRWTQGIDNGFYPQPKTWTVGLNVKF